MAIQIKPKRTATAGNVPSTSNLEAGEIAVNLADKKLFVRDASNNILELTTRTLNSLDNVNITSLADSQVLQYNSTSSKWENTTSSSGSWSQGSGLIYNTDTVGIGTATPDTTYKLDVAGSVRVTSLFVGSNEVTGLPSPFNLTANTISSNYSMPSGYNGNISGIVYIASGGSVSIPTGSVLTITQDN